MKIFKAFLLSNLEYCCAIYHYCNNSDARKLEVIQKRFLQYVLNDFHSSYADLLNASNQLTLFESRIKVTIEIVFKVLHNMLPPMESSFFTLQGVSYNLRGSNVVCHPSFNKVLYGQRSLRVQGPILWNDLPDSIRNVTTFYDFKKCLKKWKPSCKCNSCTQCLLYNV